MRWPNFFRPAWQHPDAEKRRAAIATGALEPAVLGQLALADPDVNVQKEAVAYLIRRHETALLESLTRDLAPAHPTREGIHAYLAKQHAVRWKRDLTPSAKLEILGTLPRVRLLLPYIPLIDSGEQAELVAQRLQAEPDLELVHAALAAPAFPTALKERFVQALPPEALTGLLTSPQGQAGLGKKWRQRIELLLGKDSAAENRAQQAAEKLTALHENLQQALATPSDDHPRHLRASYSKAAWAALDPAAQHPQAASFASALARLENRIAQVESSEKQIAEAMDAVLVAAATPTWSEEATATMAAFEARVQALTSQLPKVSQRSVEQRMVVVRREVVRLAELRHQEGREQVAAEERARVEQESQKQREERAKRDQERAQRDQERALQEREVTQRLEQQLDELVQQADALRVADVEPGERAHRIRKLRAAWQQKQGSGVDALRQSRERLFQAALGAADELLQQAREDEKWRQWAALQKLDEMIVKAQALIARENIPEVAKGLNELRLDWQELPREGLNKKDAERARSFQEHWDRAFERVHAAQKLCLEAVSALTSAAEPASVADVKVLQDHFRELSVPAAPQQRDIEATFRRTTDAFFDQRRQQQKALREAREANLAARLSLIAEAERVLADEAGRDRGSRLIELQRRWKEIGPVPREKAEATWTQFRAACQSFFDKQREERDHALAERDAMCAEMQVILDSLANEPVSAYTQRVPEVEALVARWDAAIVAPVQRQPLESKFRELTAKFYQELQRDRDSKQAAVTQAGVRRLELVEEAERLADQSPNPDALTRLGEIEASWAELPGAAKAQQSILFERLRLAASMAASGSTEPSPDELASSLAKKHAVLSKLAILHRLWAPERELPASPETGNLAQQLQLALQLKQEVSIPGDAAATRRRILRAVGESLREWEASGRATVDSRSALLEQFQKLMRGFVER